MRILILLFLVACNQTTEVSRKEEFLNIIRNNPVEVMNALQEASKIAQDNSAKDQQISEQKALEATFDKPLSYKIRADETIYGSKDGSITLVEYSDFECGFCARSNLTVQQLMLKYEGKIRFIYKHLPLSFHPNAMVSAKYYEAVRLQDEKKAFAFLDGLFSNQGKLRNGIPFLDSLAVKVGADLKRVRKDLDSQKVISRIEEDTKEAQALGFEGTPGFLLNGVPVKGAYPIAHFEQIILELQKRNKI
jgi:protein-disulfide isomerase